MLFSGHVACFGHVHVIIRRYTPLKPMLVGKGCFGTRKRLSSYSGLDEHLRTSSNAEKGTHLQHIR